MSFSQRKLESVLKEINRELQDEGVLTERLTQDIWTNLMSNLLQGEYLLALPIRQNLQDHIRKRRQDKIYTFARIIQRLDEILDKYIPPPNLEDGFPKKGKQVKGVSKETQGDKKYSPPQVAKHVSHTDRNIERPEERPTNVDVQTHSNSGGDTITHTERLSKHEVATQIRQTSFAPEVDRVSMHDMSIETDKEDHFEEDDVSREEYLTMKASQSVLKKTVEDQQIKIKRLEESVSQQEKKKLELLDEIKSLGADRSDKIDVYRKAEMEIKFLRNELQIKEKSLQLSLIERNELLDRLSAVTSSKMKHSNTIPLLEELDGFTRPTQVADKYSKLYETEWMDALNLLTLEMKEEKASMSWLLDILRESYAFCLMTNDSHVKLMVEHLCYPFTRTSEIREVDRFAIDDSTRQMILELKKAKAKESVAQVQVQFIKHIQRSRKEYGKDKTMKKLTSYMDRCSELCWYMVNQNPPVCLDETVRQSGDEFERESYRFYSHSGSKLDYIIWPALYLASQEGFLLVRGVAQPKQEGVALRIASSMSTTSRVSYNAS
ncbi:uncharacterized protein LOC128237042 isoform X2 [Mya arenaria]|uniref:uncharacterized protein LOC128237042 isoform X2 n=1 Tax=Mya arenaria TaxID=6604 RepID=UPI0022E074AF|nr:uncharacterized protein LOC128237042 isoform X2 [Mya arenaria]